jgi:hypothetical protein
MQAVLRNCLMQLGVVLYTSCIDIRNSVEFHDTVHLEEYFL